MAFCPAGVLAKDEAGYPCVKDIEKCIQCGWCEVRCADFAITVEQKNKKEEREEEQREEARPKGTVAAGQ